MANGPRYRVKLKRRRQGKTNYYRRRTLLKSGQIRLVIRRSTKHIRVQFVESRPNGDIILSAATSVQLKDFGWDITGGNIPAAYITGYLAGKKALKTGIDAAILDTGLQINSVGSRIYAALKGIIDAGVSIPVNEKIFPQEEVLQGSHIKIISDFLKSEDKKEFEKRFAKYQKAKIKPGELPKLVESSKAAIDKAF